MNTPENPHRTAHRPVAGAAGRVGAAKGYAGFCGAVIAPSAAALASSHAATSTGTAALPSDQFRTAPGLQPVARAMPRSVISAARHAARKSAGDMLGVGPTLAVHFAAGDGVALRVPDDDLVVSKAAAEPLGRRTLGLGQSAGDFDFRRAGNAVVGDAGGVGLGHLSVSVCLGRLIPSDECNMRASIGLGKRKMHACENYFRGTDWFNLEQFHARGLPKRRAAKSPARGCGGLISNAKILSRRAIPAGGHHGGV